MIKYQLACSCGHEFDAWFASSTAFNELQERALVSCPSCASTTVEKRPMAPAIVTGAGPSQAPAHDREKTGSAPADEQARTFVEAIRQMRAHLEARSEDVGQRFAEEARRMHFGESDARAIHGEATLEDAKSLEDDGVPFGVLPRLPEDQN